MKQELNQEKRILLAVLVFGIICFLSKVYLGFHLKSILIVAAIEGVILFHLGRRLEYMRYPSQTRDYLFFYVVLIGILGFSFYLLEQASYLEEMSYFKWLKNRGSINHPNKDFETGTTLLYTYIIFLITFRHRIIERAKENIIRWLPSFGAVICGVYLYIALNSGINHTIKIGALIVTTTALAGYVLFKGARSNEENTKYHISMRYYVPATVLAMFFVGAIGYYLPNVRELPGTRALHHFINSFGTKSHLDEWVPYTNSLNNDVPISQAQLFEVQASEPLYLRDIGYNEYHDGTWSLSEDQNYDSYIPLKTQYLEAEYSQLSSLINEIIWINSKDPSLLPEYTWLNNYESSVVTKRRYRVIQNPINKINYFTVNGMNGIIDNGIDQFYYYHSLNNVYFYSDHLMEPSEYIVTYSDRAPKLGSREYLFLHQMNGPKWENLFDRVIDASKVCSERFTDSPKLRLTYVQRVQYKNAVYGFSQVPEELQVPLNNYAKEIVGDLQSDWGRAEAIADFLKENYTYSIQNKKSEEDRVLSFLFDTREGICQDFATSMTLMCRSLGIPAKYVTGYLATDKDSQSGNYIVREKDAHAFVEVYIAGYGWMTFDPTPPSRQTQEEAMYQEIKMSDIINFVGVVAIMLMLFMISSVGRNYLREKWWQIRYFFGTPEQKITELMKGCLHKLKSKDRGKNRYETLSQYGQRLEEEGIDIRQLIKIYEKQKYGHMSPTKEELQLSLAIYKKLKKQLKNI